MLECIDSKYYGSSIFKRFLCLGQHVWSKLEKIKIGNITIIKEKYVDCGRIGILTLVNWRDK